ncbi:MBL fold metallo-hydrolase [Streptomyces boluensis]|uniref:MBL fold metallo-hydrolase n=1 Tax=Streptomyces boluensis TaxID=1775135 RepID=A0A964UJP0_9ACTN|nr:MBL fold metallo-hydrolase [Streptomyces boluensis]NBE50246.1 MBL fold metallo-hydrolase [Streptomyces boluensis]
MKVHHLNCGTMRPFGRRLVNGTGSPFRTGEMVCHCLLIETEQGLVLVDSGLGLDDIARPERSLSGRFRAAARPVLDPDETAVRQVAALGYDPADVRHIVLTHLDLDHAGGLPDFPHATVHVLGTELDAALSGRTRGERLRYPTAQRAHGPDWRSYEAGGEPWFGFDAVRQLAGLPPEILLVPLAGHTVGHAGVAVDTGDGWLLHAGDAYFFHGETDPAHPRSTPGLRLFQTLVETERTARLHNQERLLELARTAGDEVAIFSSHDPVELARHRNKPSLTV